MTPDTPISAWWLPLASFRENARERCHALKRAGVHLTFRGALHIYRQARDGMVYVKAG